VSDITPSELPRILELSAGRVDATGKEIEELCRKAVEQKLYGICVPSSRVELAASVLEETETKVIALVGWLQGTADSDVKRYETEVAVDYGAQEIEVPLNVGRLKDGDRRYVLRELRDVAEAADERIVKVLLKTRLLTREEILLACELILDSGAHFVSVGYIDVPNYEEVALCREAVGPKFGIKVADEALDAAKALALLKAGATRLGFSAGAFPLSA
jgi:deoxyribose-phosphate aldolase